MQEIFYEESANLQNPKPAAVKYNTIRILSILSYVALVLWLIMVLFYEFGSGALWLQIIFLLIPTAMFFLSGFFLGRLKNKFYVEYDYTFVSGSIRFSKVIKNVKRKFIIKFECSEIEKIGKVGSGTFEKYFAMPGVAKNILTSNGSPADNKDFYYIVVNTDEEKKLFVLECTETFMVNVLKFSNRMVLEEDYKK